MGGKQENSRRESSTRTDTTRRDGKGNRKRRANFQEKTISTLTLTTNSTTTEFFFSFQNLGAIQFIQKVLIPSKTTLTTFSSTSPSPFSEKKAHTFASSFLNLHNVRFGDEFQLCFCIVSR